MKAQILRKLIFVCLNMEDIHAILAGESRSSRYNAEHKIHVHMFPEHMALKTEDWHTEQARSDAKVEFSQESNDFDVWLSLFDLKCSMYGAYHIPKELFPENKVLEGMSVIYPDFNNKDGYASDDRLYGYAYPSEDQFINGEKLMAA